MNAKFKYLGMAALLLTSCADLAEANDASFFAPFHFLDRSRWHFSDGWVNGPYQACEWREDAVSIIDNKLQMKLSDRSGKLRPFGCPEMHTKSVTSYGYYEARLRAAAGSGLNTNLFTYTGPPTGSSEHDEIDFEFLGKDPRAVQINYYTNGKGHHQVTVPLDFDASESLHDYAIEWAPDRIRWYIDKKLVHETPDGVSLPRNPTRLYLSLWAGTSMENSWLGPFNYTQPVTAQAEWAAYTSYDKTCQFPESVACK